MKYLIKEGSQGTNYYLDPQVEKFRYNPYRKANRAKAEAYYAKGEATPYPLHLIIETSSRCNLKCGFCNREVMTRKQMNMTMETFRKVVDQAAEMGVYSLSLYCLGEQGLNPELSKMVGYAKKSGIPYVDISTNGTVGISGMWQADEIIVSLDGFKERHEQLRPPAKYEDVLNAMSSLMRMKNHATGKPIVRAQIIDFPKTHSDIPEFIDFIFNKNLADVVYVKRLEVFSQNLGDKNLPQNKIDERMKNRTSCKQLFFCLTVNADGNIAACCHDPKGLSTQGNIYNITLQKAWEGLIPKRARHASGDYIDFVGLCKNCTDWSW